MNQKGLAPIILILIIAGVLALAGGAWYLKNIENKQSNTLATPSPRSTSIATTRSSSTIDISTSSTTLTAGWKTYRNEKYGFEVRYPPSFKVNEERFSQYIDFIPLGANTYDNFQLSISSLWTRDNLTLGQFAHNNTGYVENNPDNKYDYLVDEKINLNGISVYRFIKVLGRENDWHYFFLRDQNHGVDASWTNMSTASGENPYTEEFVKILSTFKFVEPIDTSDWQTYRNEKYGFEARYPGSWSFEIAPSLDEKGQIKPNQEEFWFNDPALYRFIVDPFGGEKKFNESDLISANKINLNGVIARQLYIAWEGELSSIAVDQLQNVKYSTFVLSFIPLNARDYIEPEKASEFNQILSTFKFTSTP